MQDAGKHLRQNPKKVKVIQTVLQMQGQSYKLPQSYSQQYFVLCTYVLNSGNGQNIN